MPRNLTRRQLLAIAGASALTSLALCPSARAASAGSQGVFDPKRFRGQSIFASWSKHPFTDAIVGNTKEFEDWTGIKVEYEIIPEQQQRQKNVIQMSAKSSQIDVWESAIGVEKRQFGKAGWYQPVTTYLKDPSLVFPDWDAPDIGRGAWDMATLANGSIIGLPLQIPSIILAYRKDLLEAKGLRLESLEDLEAAAKALHNPPNMYGFVGRGLKNANVSTFAPLLFNFGGDYLDKNRHLALSAPATVKALDYYARLLRNYAPPGVVGFNWMECQQAFNQGQAALWIDGNDLLAVADDPSKSRVAGKVGYMIPPKGPGGRFAAASGLIVAINPYSRKREAGFFFNQWVVAKKQQVRALLAGAPVVRESSWKDREFLSNNQLSKSWIEAAAEVPKLAKLYMPEIIPVNQFRDILGVAITKAIEGGDPERLLKDAQAEIEPVFAETEK